jgi:IS4 transposase
MLCGKVFDRFASDTPITVMLGGILERSLPPEEVDQLFADVADNQSQRLLLFSSIVDLMTAVATRIYPSVHAAFQAMKDELKVSVQALYEKLANTETKLSEALVGHSVDKLRPIIRKLGASHRKLVKGYVTKILDGNHLAATERRLAELRDVAAGPLPGQSLVVLEPESLLASDVFCCEDAHAQERSMLDRVLATVKAQELWIEDRNFCTTKFVFGVADRKSCVLVRQHASTLRWRRESPKRKVGRIDSGMVYERTLWLEEEDGRELEVRQITLVLDEPTRDGETQIALITNLPKRVKAKRIAKLYLHRWKIEHLFLNVTTILHCELETLPYPKAALFGFCCALVAANVLATITCALASVHGRKKVEEEVSDYHVAVDVRTKYAGMMVALPSEEWEGVRGLSEAGFVKWLGDLASRVDLKRYPKKPRGPKKPRQRRTRFAKAKHIATARLLANERTKR